MKLYNFEKYYLSLALGKILDFIEKVFRYKLARELGVAVWFLAILIITIFLITYFFIGVNVLLKKIHLENYRIEKISIMNSTFNLRPYFKK